MSNDGLSSFDINKGKFSVIHFFLLSLFLMLFVQNASARVLVTAPDIVENPNVVPIALQFNPPLESEEQLVITIDGVNAIIFAQKIGVSSALSTRVRIPSSGEVEVSIVRGGAVVFVKTIKFSAASSANVSGVAGRLSTSDFRVRSENGQYRALFNTVNGFDNGLRFLSINYEALLLVGAAAGNPFFIGLQGSLNSDVKTEILDSSAVLNAIKVSARNNNIASGLDQKGAVDPEADALNCRNQGFDTMSGEFKKCMQSLGHSTYLANKGVGASANKVSAHAEVPENISLKDSTAKCEDLGIKKGTERFGKCVLTISR